jgi:hypothetical protein
LAWRWTRLRPSISSFGPARYHCDIIHGSNPIRAVDWRIGFIVGFVTRRTRRGDWALVRPRGASDCHHLELVGEPAEVHAAEDLAAWREF